MDMHSLILFGLGIACTVLGWFSREMYAAVNKLKDDLNKLEVKIGTDYVRYDRLQDALKPIREAVERIEASLTHKADKP